MYDKKVLIIRLSSIGDILLATPFIRQVSRTFPKAQIDFVIKEEFKELLKENPYLSGLIIVRTEEKIKGLMKTKRKLKKEKYNYVFDLHNNWRSNYLRRGLGAQYIGNIKKDKWKQFMLIHLKKNYYNNILSIPQRYLRVGRGLNISDDKEGLELYWDKDTEKNLEIILRQCNLKINGNIVCIAPGAGFFTKRWPIEYFNELIILIKEKFPFKLVLLGGKKEEKIGEVLSKHDEVINLCGKISLLTNAVIISKSIALISNDSGLMHMATAVNTPVLAIFGSSVKELGFYPYRNKHIVIENENLDCRPCSHIGRNSCPKDHFRCMLDIKPERVLEQFEKLLC